MPDEVGFLPPSRRAYLLELALSVVGVLLASELVLLLTACSRED